MALVKLEDSQKFINDFDSNVGIVAQNWQDSMGAKVAKELHEVMDDMTACITNMQAYEATVTQATDLFLQECGGASTSSGQNYDLIEGVMREIRIILENLTDGHSDSDSEGNGSQCSLSPDSEDERDSTENKHNLDGTMLGGAPVYWGYNFEEYDSEEYTTESVKVKRR